MLEHVNVTVSDPDGTAAWLGRVFGWHVRWEGTVLEGAGRTVHCGDETSYVALYGPAAGVSEGPPTHVTRAALNHVGVRVEDLTAVEDLVKSEGFVPHDHADYEPGRRFYFQDADGVEWEVVSYA